MANTRIKTIRGNVTRVATNAAKLNTLIHETGVLILEHALDCGDCSEAQRLVEAMPKSMRRSKLVDWFSLFSPIKVKVTDGWTAKMHDKNSKLFVPFNIDNARAVPFYELANGDPEIDYTEQYFDKMLESFIKRINKLVDDGKVTDAKAVKKARAIAAKVSA